MCRSYPALPVKDDMLDSSCAGDLGSTYQTSWLVGDMFSDYLG